AQIMDLLAGRTPKGDELYIVTDPMGHYRIERRGPGPRMALEDERFTSLLLAKRAIEVYNIDNAKAFAKAANIQALVDAEPTKQAKARREHAQTLKNGELDTLINGD